jgi:type II secretory pathway predicted ATPase ExeA
LSPDDVTKYINHRLSAVGARWQLFTDQACRVVAQASRGIPRTINILCDTALVYGFAANVQQIGPDMIEQVIQHKTEYGVLPLPDVPVAG